MLVQTVATVLLALVLALAGLSWFLGWGVGSALRSSLEEAGERTSDAAVHFCDWLRLGR